MPMHADDLFSLLYTLLTGHAALSSVITGVFEEPPAEQNGPYVVLGDFQQTGGRLLNDSERTGVLTLHIWSSYKGRKEVLQVAGLVDEALEENGFLFEDLEVFQDDESGWKHGVSTYKVYYRR